MELTLVKESLTPAVCQRILSDGLNKKEYIAVAHNVADISEKDFSNLSGISQRTLSRLKPEQKIPEQAVEVAISVMRIFQKACDLFDTAEDAQKWMKRANTALNGKTPLEAAKNRFGAEEAMNVLLRLEYGVYS